MSLKRAEKKKLLRRHNKDISLIPVDVHTFAKWLFNYFLKKCRSSHRRFSIKKLSLKISQYSPETPVSGSLFNSKYCKIFKNNYFE